MSYPPLSEQPETGAPMWRRADIALLIVVAVVLVLGLSALHAATTGKHLLDLQVYRKGAWAFVHWRDPYGAGLPGPGLPYTYTPFSTIVFAPLAWIPFRHAMGIHTVVSLGALFATVVLVVRELWGHDRSPRRLIGISGVVMVAAYWSEPVLQTLGFGQINLVLLGLITVDLLAVRSRRFGGVLIGIAAGIKLTPLIFVLYLLVTKRHRAAITAAVTAAATVALGWLLMPTPSSEYFGNLAWKASRIGDVGYYGNQSLNGMWTRLLGSDVAAKPWWEASAIVVMVVGLWVALQLHRRFGEPYGLAACAATGLLVSPISWSHHWVWCFVPAIAAARLAIERRSWALGVVIVAWSAPFYVAPFWRIPHLDGQLPSPFSLDQLLSNTYPIIALVALGAVAVWISRTAEEPTVSTFELTSSVSAAETRSTDGAVAVTAP
jgi:alpha-1,2-mannosyltransferase